MSITIKTIVYNKVDKARTLPYIGKKGTYCGAASSEDNYVIVDGAYPSSCRNPQQVCAMESEYVDGKIDIKLMTSLEVVSVEAEKVPQEKAIETKKAVQEAPVVEQPAVEKEQPAVEKEQIFSKVSTDDPETIPTITFEETVEPDAGDDVDFLTGELLQSNVQKEITIGEPVKEEAIEAEIIQPIKNKRKKNTTKSADLIEHEDVQEVSKVTASKEAVVAEAVVQEATVEEPKSKTTRKVRQPARRAKGTRSKSK